jgi:Cytochrome C oxidase, mono-heme subunit/FixO
MIKQRIGGIMVLACGLAVLLIAHARIKAQNPTSQFDQRQSNALTLEGPAIHILVTARLTRAELRHLVTDPRTVRDHPDLAEYYRSKADRMEADADKYQQIARTFGDPKPLAAPDHFNIGRNARHYHVIARESLTRSQKEKLLAALYAQAAKGEGCFTCHSLHGRGAKVGPDLAVEGTRTRSKAWLIGHFRDPQAYSPSSVMPALGGLTTRQLEALATFLEFQKER